MHVELKYNSEIYNKCWINEIFGINRQPSKSFPQTSQIFADSGQLLAISR